MTGGITAVEEQLLPHSKKWDVLVFSGMLLQSVTLNYFFLLFLTMWMLQLRENPVCSSISLL